MSDTKSDIKEKLNLFVKELKAQEFPITTISEESIKFVVEALEDYLSGKKITLDSAFGLTGRRGVPGNPEIRKDCARIALAMLRKKESWNKIEARVKSKYPCNDKRSIRRHLDEYQEELLAEELIKRLENNDYRKKCAIRMYQMKQNNESIWTVLKEFPGETEFSLLGYYDEFYN